MITFEVLAISLGLTKEYLASSVSHLPKRNKWKEIEAEYIFIIRNLGLKVQSRI